MKKKRIQRLYQGCYWICLIYMSEGLPLLNCAKLAIGEVDSTYEILYFVQESEMFQITKLELVGTKNL